MIFALVNFLAVVVAVLVAVVATPHGGWYVSPTTHDFVFPMYWPNFSRNQLRINNTLLTYLKLVVVYNVDM